MLLLIYGIKIIGLIEVNRKVVVTGIQKCLWERRGINA
jgi:hypothetical protein